ncbi:MAG TPA: hypothetical protein VGV87_19600 [Blastocatellia bacterium]|jgi:hypothetical protein|nr:hypothetical protein [Blastocatellia bacterium]
MMSKLAVTNDLISTTNPLIYVKDRLRTSRVLRDPYPHYYLEDVFPHEYYQSLLSHLPDSAVYDNLFAVTDLKLDHFRHRDQRDLNEGWTEMLPDDIKDFWVDFHRWFMGPELAQSVLSTFAEPMSERFGDESWPEVSVEAQFIRHRAGYFLGPHSDLYTKLVVLIFYLAPDDRLAHLGTSLYRPKDPGFACPDSKHYPFDDFVKVETAPYKRNSVLAFMRSDRSFHGIEPLSEQDVVHGPRDLIQYVLHDKQVRQEQLRARRLREAGE